jgi:hypothetical protein
MAQNAFDTAKQNTWEMVATKYQDIYADILADDTSILIG